jgi:hypothetical protein
MVTAFPGEVPGQPVTSVAVTVKVPEEVVV